MSSREQMEGGREVLVQNLLEQPSCLCFRAPQAYLGYWTLPSAPPDPPRLTPVQGLLSARQLEGHNQRQ